MKERPSISVVDPLFAFSASVTKERSSTSVVKLRLAFSASVMNERSVVKPRLDLSAVVKERGSVMNDRSVVKDRGSLIKARFST
jgi:hypothetical protein